MFPSRAPSSSGTAPAKREHLPACRHSSYARLRLPATCRGRRPTGSRRTNALSAATARSTRSRAVPAERLRVLVFVVAYNAERTIESVLGRIPPQLLDRYDLEVL